MAVRSVTGAVDSVAGAAKLPRPCFSEDAMRCASLVLVGLSLVTLACDRAPTTPDAAPAQIETALAAADAATGPSVTGGGTITFGSSVEHISVNVVGVSGQAVFHDKAAGGNFSGLIEINCVNVSGKVATLSGEVTKSNGGFEEGTRVVFQIVDNGEGASGPDLMSSIIVDPGTACFTPVEDLVPVKGNFKVEG